MAKNKQLRKSFVSVALVLCCITAAGHIVSRQLHQRGRSVLPVRVTTPPPSFVIGPKDQAKHKQMPNVQVVKGGSAASVTTPNGGSVSSGYTWEITLSNFASVAGSHYPPVTTDNGFTVTFNPAGANPVVSITADNTVSVATNLLINVKSSSGSVYRGTFDVTGPGIPAPVIVGHSATSVSLTFAAPPSGVTYSLHGRIGSGADRTLLFGQTTSGSFIDTPLSPSSLCTYWLVDNSATVGPSASVTTDAATVVSVSDSAVGADTGFSAPRLPSTDAGVGTDTVTVTVGRPTIEVGTTATLAEVGAAGRGPLPGVWEIDYGAGSIADNFVSNGWLVAYAAGLFTVSVPAGVTPSIGTAIYFTAYFQAAPGAAPRTLLFDTTASTFHLVEVFDSAVGSDSTGGTGGRVEVLETGVGVDTVEVIATISVTDAGVGNDDGIGPSNGINVTDAGIGVDTAIVAGITTAAQETAVGAEKIEVTNVSAGTTTTLINAYDYGASVDTVGVSALIDVADAAIGADVTDLAMPPIIAVFDSAIGSDVATVPAKGRPDAAEAILN